MLLGNDARNKKCINKRSFPQKNVGKMGNAIKCVHQMCVNATECGQKAKYGD